MRIKITQGGIFGASGEIPVGTELKVDKVPSGWAGRYIDLDADQGGETTGTADITALQDRIAELELENEDLKAKLAAKEGGQGGNGGATTPEAKHRGAGSYSIMDGDKELREKLTRDEADAFNALDAEGKAKWLKDNPAPAA